LATLQQQTNTLVISNQLLSSQYLSVCLSVVSNIFVSNAQYNVELSRVGVGGVY